MYTGGWGDLRALHCVRAATLSTLSGEVADPLDRLDSLRPKSVAEQREEKLCAKILPVYAGSTSSLKDKITPGNYMLTDSECNTNSLNQCGNFNYRLNGQIKRDFLTSKNNPSRLEVPEKGTDSKTSQESQETTTP